MLRLDFASNNCCKRIGAAYEYSGRKDLPGPGDPEQVSAMLFHNIKTTKNWSCSGKVLHLTIYVLAPS
jgi:hypothetical protein